MGHFSVRKLQHFPKTFGAFESHDVVYTTVMTKSSAAAFVSFLTLLFCAGCARPAVNSPSAAIDPDKYYAVLLNSNSVYFGKLEALTSEYPVLRDVYYVQSSVNPDTKAVTNILVRRGKEWHGPDRMILNQRAIVFVEPVANDSRVAQLIAESKK